MIIEKGQKINLTKNSSLEKISVLIEWNGPSEIEIDISSFVLDSLGKTSSDNDFIFYNNPSYENGAIELVTDNLGTFKGKLNVFFNKIPEKVSKIALTATIHEFKKRKHNFGSIKKITLFGIDSINNNKIFEFPIENVLTVETGLILGEIYRHNSFWKFNPVASGYRGGLESLCKDFGIKVDDSYKKNMTLRLSDEKLIDNMEQKANVKNNL